MVAKDYLQEKLRKAKNQIVTMDQILNASQYEVAQSDISNLMELTEHVMQQMSIVQGQLDNIAQVVEVIAVAKGVNITITKWRNTLYPYCAELGDQNYKHYVSHIAATHEEAKDSIMEVWNTLQDSM